MGWLFDMLRDMYQTSIWLMMFGLSFLLGGIAICSAAVMYFARQLKAKRNIFTIPVLYGEEYNKIERHIDNVGKILLAIGIMGSIAGSLIS